MWIVINGCKCCSERVTDALIVPVSIAYDRVPDRGFSSELMGEEKQQESFFSALKAVWNVCCGSFGEVRVNFGHPFSLQEYLDTQRGYLCQDSDEEISREMVLLLGSHILYIADCVASVMSPSIVASLLLNQHREGVSKEDLLSSFIWLCSEIEMRDRVVGFECSPEEAFPHGLEILSPFISISEKGTITPHQDLRSLLELAYCSNQLISVFLTEAVIAASIHSLCFSWLVTEALRDPSSTKFIFQSKLLERAEDLCKILHNEFTFHLPCKVLETVLADALEKLTSLGVLTCVAVVGRSEWEMDDGMDGFTDKSYKLVATKENLSYLSFTHGFIGSLIESYWSAATCLSVLVNEPMEEKDFLLHVQEFIRKRSEERFCSYAESGSLDPLKNCLKFFLQEGIVEKSDVSPSYLVLRREYMDSHKHLAEFIGHIQSYKASWL
eukprot:m.164923 g.164923  ORF g.164923 m.164923 type:complete len:440 (+) comp38886_c2_seq66:781-2100(+)